MVPGAGEEWGWGELGREETRHRLQREGRPYVPGTEADGLEENK